MEIQKISIKLGFSIGYDCFGYGLCIPHYGTIIVGKTNKIGNYACIHPSTCITDNNHQIGNNFFLANGAKIIKHTIIGNNVTIEANCVLMKDIESDNLVVGIPGGPKRKEKAWFFDSSNKFKTRVNQIENLKRNFVIS